MLIEVVFYILVSLSSNWDNEIRGEERIDRKHTTQAKLLKKKKKKEKTAGQFI